MCPDDDTGRREKRQRRHDVQHGTDTNSTSGLEVG
jgi:hypothetical protein